MRRILLTVAALVFVLFVWSNGHGLQIAMTSVKCEPNIFPNRISETSFLAKMKVRERDGVR